VIHIAELDKEIGYNFLKKCKLNVHHGIYQMFESKQTNQIMIVTHKGDLYSFDLIKEELKLIQANPNNQDITKQFKKITSAEMFDDGSRIVVSMGNGDMLVYHLTFLEGQIEMMIGPYENENKEGKEVLTKIDLFGKTNQTFGIGFNENLSTLENKSTNSFTTMPNLPISIISSGEDPMKTHRNILSSNLATSNLKNSKVISFKETQQIHSILNDVNISPNYIQQNIVEVGGLLMMSHPMGHTIFFKKNYIQSNARLINNSKVDTFFRKIIPYKRNKLSDVLFMLGDNGVILQIDFTNTEHPITSVFEGKRL
jgi:hypothetical protein